VEEQILKVYKEAGFSFTEPQQQNDILEKTRIYLAELNKWNSQINLTSRGDQGHILQRHFSESLQYAKGMNQILRLVDIGSGAGFPGIPLKIVFPEIQIVFIESLRKRVSFLESVSRKMKFTNYQVLIGRAEEMGMSEEYNCSFDAATFRSVASLRDCLTLGSPFLKENGKILVKKEPDITLEDNHPMYFDEEFEFTTADGRESKLLVFNKCST
jgi:16S rRNA (guanine527-N7)-methyltransferase